MSRIDYPVMLANPAPCHGMWTSAVFDMGSSAPKGCGSEYRAPNTGAGAAHKTSRQSLRLAVKSASDGRVKGEVQTAYWKPLFSPKKSVKKDDSAAATKPKTPSRANTRAVDGDMKGVSGKRKRNPSPESNVLHSCQSGNDGKSMKKEKEHDKYCHFCQHVKVNMLACESPDCTHRFCTYCLAVHLGDNTDPSSSSSWKMGQWSCPTCRQECCCSLSECSKSHRHCKAFRYRCRRANAANLRMSAAHALVSLGVSSSEDPKNKGCKMQKISSAGKAKKIMHSSESGSVVPLGPPDGTETNAPGNKHEEEDQKAILQAQADRVLGLLCMITAEQANEETEDSLHSDCSNESDSPCQDYDEEKAGAEPRAESCTSSLEELALFALQSLSSIAGEELKAAPAGPETGGRTGDVSPGRLTAERSPSTPREDLSDDSASSEPLL